MLNSKLFRFNNTKLKSTIGEEFLSPNIRVGIDWITLLVTLFLVVIGLASIYSSSPNSLKLALLQKQLISTLIGIFLLLIILYLPSTIIKNTALPIYIFSILLLLGVLAFGTTIKGTKGWIRLGSFSLQPSEIAKLGVLLILSRYIAMKGTDIRTLRNSAISIFITLIPLSLIILQPDIGSATVILSMLLGIFFWTGFEVLIIYTIVVSPFVILLSLLGQIYFIVTTLIFSSITFAFRKKIFLSIFVVLMFIVLGIASPLIYENLMPHQQNRIQSFLNPGSDPRGNGYNVWQSMLAVGSGGLTGKGYMQGTLTQLKYIPEQWTDFIFSVSAEEFGFIGAFIVLIAELTLIIRLYNIAYNIEDKFFSIICFGSATIFFYHCLINIGMVIGVSPVMGIPLPFMSYGGSAIIINLMLVGFSLHAHRHNILKRKI